MGTIIAYHIKFSRPQGANAEWLLLAHDVSRIKVYPTKLEPNTASPPCMGFMWAVKDRPCLIAPLQSCSLFQSEESWLAVILGLTANPLA
jgi:hypothetical protein